MHPTPNEQLQAIGRRLEQVAADSSLAPDTREALDDAQRLLRRLERSWAARLPFLLVDNQLAAELLDTLAPLLPDLTTEIRSVVAATTAAPIVDHNLDEPTVHERNKQLQGLLGRAVHLLPDNAEGDAARARIASHLRSRIAADPALNRAPIDRRPPQEPNP